MGGMVTNCFLRFCIVERALNLTASDYYASMITLIAGIASYLGSYRTVAQEVDDLPLSIPA